MSFNGPLSLYMMTTLVASLDQTLNGWEKGGIVGVAGIIVAALWRRDNERTKLERARQLAAEKERLAVQKDLLQAHKDHAATVQGILMADFEAKHRLSAALENLTSKVEAVPCHKITTSGQ